MVLLEVVLAMAIFFAGAMVILAGLSASVRSIGRVKLDAQAQDLAVSLLSEVQMGLVPLVSDGPKEYDDPALAGWTWQIAVQPYDEPQPDLAMPQFQTVEVTIRREVDRYATSLTAVMTEPQTDATGTGAMDATGGTLP